MRKTRYLRRNRSFVAGGLGRYGPFAVYTHRITKGIYAKVTGGTRGVTTGLKLVGRQHSFEFGMNHTTNAPYAKIKRRSRR